MIDAKGKTVSKQFCHAGYNTTEKISLAPQSLGL